ncbi:TPA: restriction endonuclease subunit S, partial [Campylobacter upsaliensis]|nr:restriction endonuclease subunit S [Campylobacter upsaliensis]
FSFEAFIPTQMHYFDKIAKIWNERYETKRLEDMIISSISGDWGCDEGQKDNRKEYIKCLVIRSTEFDNNGDINFEKSRAKYRFIEKTKYYEKGIEAGDILIEKSGGSENQPVGRVCFVNNEIVKNHKCYFSNFIQKITLNKEVSSEYICYYLWLINKIKLTERYQSQTNGIRNLIMKNILNLKIPLPPLTEQERIAKEISQRKAQAKALKQEAKELLESAKKEVEHIILGG